MVHCEDRHGVVRRQSAALGDVSVEASRENEFATAILGLSAEQRVIGEHLKGPPYAQQLPERPLRILGCEKVEQSLQIGERARSCFDARYDRAFGRRAFAPVTHVSR